MLPPTPHLFPVNEVCYCYHFGMEAERGLFAALTRSHVITVSCTHARTRLPPAPRAAWSRVILGRDTREPYGVLEMNSTLIRVVKTHRAGPLELTCFCIYVRSALLRSNLPLRPNSARFSSCPCQGLTSTNPRWEPPLSGEDLPSVPHLCSFPFSPPLESPL